MKSLLSLSLLVGGIFLMSSPAYGFTFCVTRDFRDAVASAEAVFSGRIVQIERVQQANTQYIVRFSVDSWWKGAPKREVKVLWHSSILDCPDLPVGEIGKDYLVYADPPKQEQPGGERLLEVKVFSRTSKLPFTQRAGFGLDFGKKSWLELSPELDRSDASNDVKALRLLRDCSCLPVDPSFKFEPPFMTSLSAQEFSSLRACNVCLRNRSKTF